MALTKRTLFVLSILMTTILFSCKEKDPSILKIYVRSNVYALTEGATVRIVGDLSKNTPEYFDEKTTNESGVAIFNLDGLFDQYGKDEEKVAYFNVYTKGAAQYYTVTQVRSKAHLISTGTVVLEE